MDDAGAFADAFGANIVAGTLTKQKVLLLVMPGASSTTRDNVKKQIGAAGGAISGEVQLTRPTSISGAGRTSSAWRPAPTRSV